VSRGTLRRRLKRSAALPRDYRGGAVAGWMLRHQERYQPRISGPNAVPPLLRVPPGKAGTGEVMPGCLKASI